MGNRQLVLHLVRACWALYLVVNRPKTSPQAPGEKSILPAAAVEEHWDCGACGALKSIEHCESAYNS